MEYRDNPITIAAIVGLAWGLVLGLADGLPALLEGDPLNVLGRRLLTLTSVAVFDALVFGLVVALVGAVVWAILRLTRWQPSEAGLLGLLVGLAVIQSTDAFCLQRYPEAALILVAGLALVTGAFAGWLARAVGRNRRGGKTSYAR